MLTDSMKNDESMLTDTNEGLSHPSDHQSKISADDNLLNYLEVLSHLTGSLLNFRGKIFKGKLFEENDQDEESDEDSDDENSSNTLGNNFGHLVVA